MIKRWIGLARKVPHRPPAAALRGVQRELRRQLRRPSSWLRPRLLSERSLLTSMHAASVHELWTALAAQPFFVSPATLPAWCADFRRIFPAETAAIVAAADEAMAHRFDLLGSGVVALGPSLPWHDDFKAGKGWPLHYSPDLEVERLDDESDIKVPWELSRFQHLVPLAQAYRLTGDDRYAREAIAQIDDWIAKNPYARGVNWVCAMDVALRAVSWIWTFYFLADARALLPDGFASRFLRALYLHGEFVFENLEKVDLNGNHYLCDGVGLIFIGTFFRRSRAGQRWLDLGVEIVTGEIERQVHADGVDFEKSTAYHRLVLEAFLSSFLLMQRHGLDVPRAALDRLHRMFTFVAAYTGPDGRAPLVGDADDGRIQKLGTQDLNDHRYLLSTGAVLFSDAELRGSADRCWDESFWLLGPECVSAFDALASHPLPSTAFPEGGFYVMRRGGNHVFVDCGEVGMGQGTGAGHGHNDILSFELVLDGTRILTDCGSYVYTASRQWRNHFRGTAMHNTVQVDGAEINRYPSDDDLWRLREDAHPVDVVWRPGERCDYFRGAHTGYNRVPHQVRHTREIVLDHHEPLVVIRDHLTGPGHHEVNWRFHFVPGTVATVEGPSVRARIGGRDAWLTARTPLSGSWRIENSWVSPRYGVREPAPVAVLSATVPMPVSADFVVTLKAPAPDAALAALAECEV